MLRNGIFSPSWSTSEGRALSVRTPPHWPKDPQHPAEENEKNQLSFCCQKMNGRKFFGRKHPKPILKLGSSKLRNFLPRQTGCPCQAVSRTCRANHGESDCNHDFGMLCPSTECHIMPVSLRTNTSTTYTSRCEISAIFVFIFQRLVDLGVALMSSTSGLALKGLKSPQFFPCKL